MTRWRTYPKSLINKEIKAVKPICNIHRTPKIIASKDTKKPAWKERSFIIDRPPFGKERPRFSTHSGTARTAENTKDFESYVAMLYALKFKSGFMDGPVMIQIMAYYKIPKSVPKWKINLMLRNEIRPLVKPDADNIEKAVLDALNKIAYWDDSQIVDIHTQKYYSDTPHVEVSIRGMEDAE